MNGSYCSRNMLSIDISFLHSEAILLVRKLLGQGRPCFVMAPNRELAHEENRRVVITLQLYLQLQ